MAEKEKLEEQIGEVLGLELKKQRRNCLLKGYWTREE